MKTFDELRNITNIEKKLDLQDEKINTDDWEIEKVLDVYHNEDDFNRFVLESNQINLTDSTELKEFKLGDYVYLTVLLKRKGHAQYDINSSKMGVLKCRITDIYNNLNILRNLKK